MARALNLLFEQIAIPTSIYYLLANLASIQPSLPASQPRTTLVKFARSPRTDRPGSVDPFASSSVGSVGGKGGMTIVRATPRTLDIAERIVKVCW